MASFFTGLPSSSDFDPASEIKKWASSWRDSITMCLVQQLAHMLREVRICICSSRIVISNAKQPSTRQLSDAGLPITNSLFFPGHSWRSEVMLRFECNFHLQICKSKFFSCTSARTTRIFSSPVFLTHELWFLFRQHNLLCHAFCVELKQNHYTKSKAKRLDWEIKTWNIQSTQATLSTFRKGEQD